MNRFKRIACVLAFVVLFTGLPVENVHAGETTVPTAYMNDIDVVSAMFPSTKSQQYNDCWAFSAVGLAEFDMITDNQVADQTVDYSELQLAYFTYHHVVDPLGGTSGDFMEIGDGYNYLTLGGLIPFAVRTLLQWVGLTSEALIPYTEAYPTRVLDENLAYESCEAHLQNVYRLNIHAEPEQVKREIMRHGAAGIGIYEGNSRERAECEGSGEYLGRMVPTYYCSKEGYPPNHALNVIGWDDEFPAQNFSSLPAGDGAWLVRNSWSTAGGYNADTKAYFWLSYYDMSLEDDAWICDFEEAGNYDYNYQYDGSIFCENSYASEGYAAVANVFQVSGERNETLEAVSVSLMSNANVPYTIKVYTNLANGKYPCSGYLAARVTGTTRYAGVHTIRLPKSVSLVKGTKYSVVVELKQEDVEVDVEYGFQQPGMYFSSVVSIEQGQSFAIVDGKWQDMEVQRRNVYIDLWDVDAYTGNWCIKAYTSGLEGKAVDKVGALKKKAAAKNSITVGWDKVKGASGYEVFRATSKNGTYKKIATVKSGKTNYKDAELTKNKTYYYRVRAYRKNSVTDENGVKGTTTTVGKMSDVKAIKTTAK